MALEAAQKFYAGETLQTGSLDRIKEAILERGVIHVATSNADKIREAAEIIRSFGLDLKVEGMPSLPDDYEEEPEPQLDVQGVAATKAIRAFQNAMTSMRLGNLGYDGRRYFPVAEDNAVNVIDEKTGEETPFPGVLVKRAFEDIPRDEDKVLVGCQRLINLFGGKPVNIYSSLAVSLDGQHATHFTGVVKGHFATEVMPGPYGFGFDAAIILDGMEQSLAQTPPQLKNAVSMRAKSWEMFLQGVGLLPQKAA